MADSREMSASGFLKLRKLHEKLQWPYFKSSLEDLMYMYAKISKMEDISKGRMVDFAFFKKEDIDSYNDALDGGDTTSSGDDSMQAMAKDERKKKKARIKKRVAKNKDGKFTQEYIDACYALAVEQGDGFLPWVYKVYVAVKDALSEAILDQVAGCQRGDLITLLAELQMAVGNTEAIDSTKLYLDVLQATMASVGDNDLLKFTSFLKQTQPKTSSKKRRGSVSDYQA